MVGWPASRRRGSVAVLVALFALAAAAGLAIGLTRGGSPHLSWAPTESTKPVRTVVVDPAHQYTFAQAVKAGLVQSLAEEERESGLPLCGTKPPSSGPARAAYERTVKRNDGDTCMADPRRATYGTGGTDQLFFALNAVQSGDDELRYVDSHGWAIVYPRSFHAVAYSTTIGTAAGTDGSTFANFTPVPAGSGPVPVNGVLLSITTTWSHIGGLARLGQNSHFPLHLPASVTTELDFQGNGVAYHLSVVAGPKASRADLDVLRRMVASISFPPAGGARASGGQSRPG
jgi:hypothetical protein